MVSTKHEYIIPDHGPEKRKYENSSIELPHAHHTSCRAERHEINPKIVDIANSNNELEGCLAPAQPKKKNKVKSTINNVFRSLRSRADKLLTNFLSSGNYNRLIIATSAATAAVKRSSITDTEEDDGENNSFHCGPQITVSLGKVTSLHIIITIVTIIIKEKFDYLT